jgi:hypothetical protein
LDENISIGIKREYGSKYGYLIAPIYHIVKKDFYLGWG